jgi:hypothetical protein
LIPSSTITGASSAGDVVGLLWRRLILSFFFILAGYLFGALLPALTVSSQIATSLRITLLNSRA